MKNKISVAAAMFVIAIVSGCNKDEEQATKEIELETTEQKISYLFGYQTAKQINAQGFTLDPEIVARGVEDVYAGNESALTDEQQQATMVAFQTEVQAKRQEMLSTQREENLAKGQAFLSDNAKREGVVVTESGLQYEVVTAGDGASPTVDDKVKVKYRGTLIDGTEFDKNESMEFVVGRLIPAWIEALPLMKVGDSWKLYAPPELAYGAGETGSIPPNSTLVFEIELLDITTPAATESK